MTDQSKTAQTVVMSAVYDSTLPCKIEDEAPWMIKGFSVALRQQITQAARRQGCTVADWLHGHFQKLGVEDQNLVVTEPRHLTAKEQGIMQRALRRSLRIPENQWGRKVCCCCGSWFNFIMRDMEREPIACKPCSGN